MRSLFLLPVLLALAGCGSDDFTCSSSNVIDKVGDLTRQQMSQTPVYGIFDVKNASFRVEDVRQQSGNSHSISCAANIYARLVPAQGMANNPDVAQYKKMAEAIGKQAMDVTYTVEKLDQGGFYITVRGL
jgi:hypothetical protein